MNAAYERYLKDEEFRAAIAAAVRRERSKTMLQLIVAPFKALLTAPRLRPTRMLRRSAA